MRRFKVFGRLGVVLYIALAIAGAMVLGASILFFVIIKDLPQIPQPLSKIIERPPTEIFGANGERLMVLGGREFTPIDRVSEHFIQAILSTEDHRFWSHHGIDKLRTLKALWVTLFHPGKIQGASTITQQLAKNLFFSFEQTFSRKFREFFIALQIESQFDKREILETYINQITFGVGIYGIEPAADAFFGKTAAELTLNEAALLAGLPKSPVRYNPYRYPERAKMRRHIVLKRLHATGYIAASDVDLYSNEELVLKERHPSKGKRSGSHFLDYIVNVLEERYAPEVVYHGGLKVTTTIDPNFQEWAENAVKEGLIELEKDMGIVVTDERDKADQRPQGALVAIDTQTGAIKAMVGGRDYFESEYNRAVKSNRQPGSGFKPFLYYSAFESLGMTPASVMVDEPVSISVKGTDSWIPKNFGRDYIGPVILKKGFMLSVNTIAAQLVELTGPKAVVDVAKRCGINSKLDPVFSIALGTSGVSPLEMASSFATFATGGLYHEPYAISRVEDAQKNILEENIVSGQRRLDEGYCFQVVDMMRAVVDEGTGRVIRRLGMNLPAAGKTGTTNGYADAWFTGFTPTLSTSVWVGYDKVRVLKDKDGRGITGGRGAAPIWARFMARATEGNPPREFKVPSDIRFKFVDVKTGYRSLGFFKNAMRVPLRQDQKTNG